jgi:hypothetical protein
MGKRKRAPHGATGANPVLEDVVNEKDWRIRAAYVLLPLGGLALAVATTLARYGKPNPAAPILFVGGILAAVAIWALRRGRREALTHLTVAVLVGVLVLSLATLDQKDKPAAKRTGAAQMSSMVDGLGTNVSTCLANFVTGRWDDQGCSTKAPKKHAKKKAQPRTVGRR